jgi:hypothetical protein
LASSLNFSIPWVFCNGEYAGDGIATCNGCYCDDDWMAYHLKIQPDKPALWTENEGWFDQYGVCIILL